MQKLLFALFFCLKTAFFGFAQDVAAIRKAKPAELSGHLGAGAFFNQSDRNAAPPFGWSLSGSVNLRLFGALDLPVALGISDRQLNYNAPTFRRVGISPTWKWATVHAGYRNLSISPYALSGFTFLGGGLELKPKKFRLMAMRGKLDPTWIFPTENLVSPASDLRLFDRWATGGKIGFGSERNFFDLFFLKSGDRTSTGDADSLARLFIHPQQNLVVGSAFKFTFFKRLTIESSVAASGVTDNLGAIELPIGDDFAGLFERANRLLTINTSTRYAFAGDAAATLQIGPATIGGKLQRIDPFYRSFGVYFIQNDFENRLGTASLRLFRGKMNLSGSFGQQRDNLKGYRPSTVFRQIGSLSAQFSGQKGWTASGQFSNFTTDQQAGLVAIDDSVRIASTSRNTGFSISKSWKKGSKRHSTNVTANLSQFRSASLNPAEPALFQTKTAAASHRIQLGERGFSIRTGLNWSAFDQAGHAVERWGLTAGGDKNFRKKARLGLQTNFSLNRTDGAADGFVSRSSLTASLPIGKKMSLTASTSWYLRKTERLRPVDEWQGRAGWSMRF